MKIPANWVLFSSLLIAQSNGGTYSLSGTVVNSVTGEPIRNAIVTVSRTPTPQELEELQQEAVKAGNPRLPLLRKSVLSGLTGDYQITGLPEGHYLVGAHKPGFTPAFDAEGHGPDGVDLSAAAGNITVRLAPLGAIEGTVVDQNGEPIDNVKVEAYTATIMDGARSIMSRRNAVCDDRGHFRIWDLEPGQYRLKATGRNGGTYLFMGQGTPRPSSWLSFVPVYTGGAATFDSATPVVIEAGTQARADFRLNLVPAATIRGMLENYTFHQRVTFSLRQESEDLADDSRVNLSSTTGRFEITAIPPGDYTLIAQEGQMALAEVPIHVSENGVTGLSVPLWPAVTVPVNLHVTGPPAARKALTDDDDDAPAAESQCHLSLSNPMRQQPIPMMPHVSAPGQIDLDKVFPGQYRVEFLCSGGYVTSATFGTSDLLADPRLTIEPGGTPPPIEIAMKPGGGTIHGKLSVQIDRQGAILAVPAASSSTGPVLQGIFGGGDEFTLVNLAPGDYTLYAFNTRFDQIEYRNPAVLQKLTGGTTVHVDDGKTSEVAIDKAAK